MCIFGLNQSAARGESAAPSVDAANIQEMAAVGYPKAASRSATSGCVY
jgi:hypothetical protein